VLTADTLSTFNLWTEPEAADARQVRSALIAELGAERLEREERFGQLLLVDQALALAVIG
jgi:hypothetical protein